MMGLPRDQLSRFADLLGPKGYCDDQEIIAPWLQDWRGLYRGVADAMLMPESPQQVMAVMALANELRVPLVPQGGNTSMVGGATPPADGSALILSLRRMNRIRTIDAEAGIANVDAGVVLSDLHDAALAQGMRFPLSLGAKGSATIGGLVSTNAGGTQVLRFGTMRKLVLGVEAVLPDGMLFDGLAALKKDTRGYDPNQLLIGAEGTLGIVTGASLRLVPAIADRSVAWIGLKSPQVALDLLRWLEARSGDAIESFEIMPSESLALVEAYLADVRIPLTLEHRWHVLIEYVAGQDAQAGLAELLAGAFEAGLADDAVISANETQAEALWRIRESISAAERAAGPAIQHDISVPVEDMPDFMVTTAEMIERAFPGVSASAFGHLGDGNVHFHVRAPAMPPEQVAGWRAGAGKAASRMVYDLTVAANGSISAEHGIGQMKRDELGRLSSPARLAMLRAIKGALDPLGLMNPGKLVPLALEDTSK
jgi:FAD/FMN-containing dehydrogenase